MQGCFRIPASDALMERMTCANARAFEEGMDAHMENENRGEQAQEDAQENAQSSIERGVMKLKTPIRAGGKDVTELCYDFTSLTGWEYAEAMDMDREARGVFSVTDKQALCLFAATAGKETDGIDATDIRKRMGVVDAVKAVQLATVFLVTSTREVKGRTSGA